MDVVRSPTGAFQRRNPEVNQDLLRTPRRFISRIDGLGCVVDPDTSTHPGE